MTLRTKLRSLRKKQGLSLKKMAELSNISYYTLLKLERKESEYVDARMLTIKKIAEFYKTPLHTFIENVDTAHFIKALNP